LSFLCVKALAMYGVSKPAVVLLSLLAGAVSSFFGFFGQAALCEAETVASSVTFGSHETFEGLEGVSCPYDSSFWYDASYAGVLSSEIPDSVLETHEQELHEFGSSSEDAQLELITASDELRERIMAVDDARSKFLGSHGQDLRTEQAAGAGRMRC